MGVISYGSGNVNSVCRALEKLGCEPILSSNLESLSKCSHLILPGVGSFSSTKNKLDSHFEPARFIELAQNAKAFLGICVGLQVLAEKGLEFGITDGFGLISGVAEQIQDSPLLPHMGWNNLTLNLPNHPLLQGISEDDDFYFVHSYAISHTAPSEVIASAQYGSTFPAIMGSGNIFGTQFHPEKSSVPGAKVLRNFLSI